MHVSTLRHHISSADIAGWLLLCGAFALYASTVAPTLTLWDSGEFALCGRWLEVGHPPGAPLYILFLRLATMLSPTDESAFWFCNMLSVATAAVTVWCIYRISLILIELSLHCRNVKAIAAAAIAAATFAVTDTFWTSATETEVYAPSLLLLSITLYVSLRWLMLKRSGINSNRHMAMVALLLGMSASVHLLGLLLIPCIAIIIAIGCDERGLLHMVSAFAIGCIALLIIYYCLILNGLAPAKTLELLCVNILGLPLHSGLVAYALLLFGALFAILFTTRLRHNILHSIALFLLLFLIGYSPVSLTIIRSCSMPSLCLDAPDNVFALDNYVNREQYGSRPLIKGAWYNAQPVDVNYSTSIRCNENRDAYETYETFENYTYDDTDEVFFPRMYSHEPLHAYGYSIWSEVDTNINQPPSFADELRFFFAYQLNFMFVRYVLWNFVGRQNDISGYGSVLHGNWISGISFIDSYLGQRKILHPLEADSQQRAVYFGLPLLLALVGVVCTFNRRCDRRISLLPLLLFAIAGPCLVLYLNQPPFEPRERDYVYLGAFMAVALFIGFGAFAIIDFVSRKNSSRLSIALIITALCLASPILVLLQNIRSHNRTNDTLARDMARSYLSHCEPNALLITCGDNDTYPLWAVQEVENFRRDVRVINFGTLAADWNIAQLQHSMRGNNGFAMTISHADYREGQLDYAIVNPSNNDTISLHEVINQLVSTRIFPSRNIKTVCCNIDTLCFTLPENFVERNQLALLDIIATDSLRRPIYETATSTAFAELGLPNCDLGAVRKLTADTTMSDARCIDKFLTLIQLPTASTYNLRDDHASALQMMQHRLTANRAAKAAIGDNRLQLANDILIKSLREEPISVNVNDKQSVRLAELLYNCGNTSTSRLIFRQLTEYYLRCVAFAAATAENEQRTAQIMLDDLSSFGQSLVGALQRTGNSDLSRSIAAHCQSWNIEMGDIKINDN